MTASIFSIGKSGLMASKKSLQTTGHNLSNTNTEGYTRRRVEQISNLPVGEGNVVIGTGTQVKSIRRIFDENINTRLNQHATEHRFNEERTSQLNFIESIFNEVNTDGLNKILNRFFNSFRELSNQPENETVRSIVRENAKLVVRDFHRIQANLDKITHGIELKISRSIADLNQLLHNIAELNLKISEIENTHGEAGDLRDQRDLAVKTVSELLNVKTYLDDKNRYVLMAPNVGTLVVAGLVNELKTAKVPLEDSTNNRDGAVEIFLSNKPRHSITRRLKSGTFGALLGVRNQEISGTKKHIDEIAFNLANAVNAIHRRGYANREFTGSNSQSLTNINFFKITPTSFQAAEKLDLSDDIKSNVNNIVTALQPNSPGDNRVSLAISKLQHEKILGNNEATLEEEYLKSISNIGLQLSKSEFDQEQSQSLLAQAIASRERISGVSIDEETANMVKFQKSYEASAKVINAANKMFDVVLGIMR